MNLWAIFLTGLTTGGLTCLAMQGGLLAGIIANQKEDELETSDTGRALAAQSFDQLDWLPVTLFLVSKLVAHTILGVFLGWLGSQIALSLGVRLFFQGLAALFMLATAANLLDIHPIFRYVVFQPPKFMYRWVKSSTHGKALFTPAVLGLMTIFIPCGVTQAMEVLAVTSGSPVLGAMIMFAFVLGTSPLFALLGVVTAKLSEQFKQGFLKIAAALLVFLSINSINGILIVMNSPVSLNTIVEPIRYFFSDQRFAEAAVPIATVDQGVQKVTITISDYGYSPKQLRVKAGTPVELTLVTNETYSCASSFVMKAFNISLQLAPTDQQTVTFTPGQKGKFPFTCAMGMYSGVMEVI